MNLETDPERSLLLATKSVRIMSEANETVLPLSNSVLHQSIIKSKVRLTLTGHDGRVRSVAYSPDGQRIVTASADYTAKVWNANTGKELLTLTGHNHQVWSAVYSPDGQRIVTAGADRIVQIHTTDMDELLQIAESRVTRQLTAEEKETYGVLGLN